MNGVYLPRNMEEKCLSTPGVLVINSSENKSDIIFHWQSTCYLFTYCPTKSVQPWLLQVHFIYTVDSTTIYYDYCCYYSIQRRSFGGLWISKEGGSWPSLQNLGVTTPNSPELTPLTESIKSQYAGVLLSPNPNFVYQKGSSSEAFILNEYGCWSVWENEVIGLASTICSQWELWSELFRIWIKFRWVTHRRHHDGVGGSIPRYHTIWYDLFLLNSGYWSWLYLWMARLCVRVEVNGN